MLVMTPLWFDERDFFVLELLDFVIKNLYWLKCDIFLYFCVVKIDDLGLGYGRTSFTIQT